MIRKVLVATDGSAVSAKAAAFSADLASQVHASLTLLGVVDSGYLLPPAMPASVMQNRVSESTEDVIRQAIQAYLDETATECRTRGIDVATVIRTGHPVEEILKQAEAERADLIVLGSHGRSALQAAVLGSVAYGVLHKDARIPVLIVRR